MEAEALYSDLLRGGFRLRLDGSALAIHPASKLTPEQRQAVARLKPELVAILLRLEDAGLARALGWFDPPFGGRHAWLGEVEVVTFPDGRRVAATPGEWEALASTWAEWNRQAREAWEKEKKRKGIIDA